MQHSKDKYKWISSKYFKSSLKKKLEADVDLILKVLHIGKNWEASEDKQIDALEKLCLSAHAEEKILIFTQFADTAKYLEKELTRRGIKDMLCVTGDTDNPTEIAHRFSPQSNKAKLKKSEVRIVITTDVLSEGQNLQDGHIIVNFDLPWALIRLIQRAGRVDRIGQQSPDIYCYSFLPAEGVEKIINLRGRLQDRIKENSEVVGSDEMFFDGDPVNIRDLYSEKSGILDEGDDDEVDLTTKAYEIWNKATQNDPKLKKTIINMPNIVYSTKEKPDDVLNNGVITYHKTAYGVDVLTWLDEFGSVRSRSQNRILKVLECEPDTKALEALPDHHVHVEKAVELAKKAQRSSGGHLGKKSSARYKSYMILNRYYQENMGTLFESEELKRTVDDIYNHPLQENTNSLINRRLRLGLQDAELAELLIGLRAEGRLCIISDHDTKMKTPQVICSMGLRKV
jgi:superfamily II DNA/RNA helicase